MDSSSPGGYIILFAVLLFLDIVVYGFGSALRALRPEIASQEAEPRGDQTKDRSIIRKVLNDQSDYVDTVSSVTALINLTAGACFVPAAAEKLATAAGWPYLLCFVLTICVLLIVIEVFGVQLPKRLAAASPDKWIRRFGGIFRLLLAAASIDPHYRRCLERNPFCVRRQRKAAFRRCDRGGNPFHGERGP